MLEKLLVDDVVLDNEVRFHELLNRFLECDVVNPCICIEPLQPCI